MKEEVVKNFGLRKKQVKKKEVELVLLTEEAWIMTTDVSIMDPTKKGLFEKKHKFILEQDA